MKAKQGPRVVLRKSDLIRQTFRAGGPGGQHQNKTESAVRYIHKPTGIAAEARSERSQSSNDAKALESLQQKLLMAWLIARGQSARDAWKDKPDVSFGAQMRSYVLAGNSQRVQDHETGHEVRNTKSVLDGGIDGFIEASLKQKALEQWDSGTPV